MEVTKAQLLKERDEREKIERALKEAIKGRSAGERGRDRKNHCCPCQTCLEEEPDQCNLQYSSTEKPSAKLEEQPELARLLALLESRAEQSSPDLTHHLRAQVTLLFSQQYSSLDNPQHLTSFLFD